MNIDERNMNMRQMIDKFNKTVKDIDSLKFIIDAVKRQPELEKKEWTANDSNVVIGETYYIQSVGVYKIKGTGKGKISWTVKSPKDMKVLYHGQMDDTAESDEMILTAGDVCYLNASADGGETLVMVLEQTQSLFEMMGTDLVQLQKDVESMNSRLGNALTGVDTKVDEAVDAVKDALGYVTPEMFGAVGDGVTDDTESIQDAIDYCKTEMSKSGKNIIVAFPSGKYKISSTLIVPNFVKLASLGTVELLNYADVMIKVAYVESPVRVSTHWSLFGGCTISGYYGGFIFINRNSSDSIALEIGDNFTKSTNAQVTAWTNYEHITFIGFSFAIVMNTVGNYLNNFVNLKFSMNKVCVYFRNNVNLSNSGENFSFERCIFGDVSDVAFLLEWSDSYTIEMNFSHCSFDFCKNGVFRTSNCCDIHISECHFEGIGTDLPDNPYNGDGYIMKSLTRRSDIQPVISISNSEFMNIRFFMFCSNIPHGLSVILDKVRITYMNIIPSLYMCDQNTDVLKSSIIQFKEYNLVPSLSLNLLSNYNLEQSSIGSLKEHTDLGGDLKIQYIDGTSEIVDDVYYNSGKSIKCSKSQGFYDTFISKSIPCSAGDRLMAKFDIKSNIEWVPRKATIRFFDRYDKKLSTTEYETATDDNSKCLKDTWSGFVKQNSYIAPPGTSYCVVTFVLNPKIASVVYCTNFGLYKLN